MIKSKIFKNLKFRYRAQSAVGMCMVLVAVFAASAPFLFPKNSSRAQRSVAQSPEDRALEVQCIQRVVDPAEYRNKIILFARTDADVPDEVDGDPYGELNSAGVTLYPESTAQVQFVNSQTPECLEFLRQRAQRYHLEEEIIEGGSGSFQVDANSRREYCHVPIPQNLSGCPFTLPTDPYIVADLNPSHAPLLLRRPVESLLHLTSTNASDLTIRQLKFFVTPRPLFAHSPTVHFFRETTSDHQSWAKDRNGLRGYVSFIAMAPPGPAPAIMVLPHGQSHSAFPVSDSLYNRFANADELSGGSILQATYFSELNRQGATALVQQIRLLAQSLADRWRLNPQSLGQSAGWVQFFERRALVVQNIKQNNSARLLGSVAEYGHELVSYYLANATDTNTITDAAGLWWTLRELQLGLACNAPGTQLENPELQNLVEMQYSLQNCRHHYVHQAVTALNRIVRPPSSDETPGEFQLDTTEWVRSFVLGSRQERAKNMVIALSLMSDQLRRGFIPNSRTFYALRSELEQLQEELNRNQVVTWLGLKEMKAEDHDVLIREVAAFQRFFRIFGAWIQPHRSQRISEYVALRSLWRDYNSLLSLRPWSELYTPPALNDLGVNLNRSLNALQIPEVSNPIERLRPLSELLSFTASAYVANPTASIEACSTISQWMQSHPEWINLTTSHEAAIPMAELAYTPPCFSYIAKLINNGDARRFISFGNHLNLEQQCSNAQEQAPILESAAQYASIVCPLDLLLKPTETRNLPAQWQRLLSSPLWTSDQFTSMVSALHSVVIEIPPVTLSRSNPWVKMIATLIEREKQQIRSRLVLPTAAYLKRCLSEDIGPRSLAELPILGSVASGFMVRNQCLPRMGDGPLAMWLSQQFSLAKRIALQRGEITGESLRPDDADNLALRLSRWISMRTQFEDWLFRAGGLNILRGQPLLSARDIQNIRTRLHEDQVAISLHPHGAQPPLTWISTSLQYIDLQVLPLLRSLVSCNNGRALPCFSDLVLSFH